MYNWKHCILLFVILFITLAFMACGEDNINTKVVNEKYLFSNGSWHNVTQELIPGAISELKESTFSISGGGVSISYIGVYTTDGGETLSNASVNSWAYLYDNSGKIGIVIIGNGNSIEVGLGKTFINNALINNGIGTEININDMQDINNGFARND